MIENDNIQLAGITIGFSNIYKVYSGETLIWPPIYNIKGTFGPETSVIKNVIVTVEKDASNNFKAYIHPDVKELKFIRCHFKDLTEIPDFTSVKNAESIFNGNTIENNTTITILKKIENTVKILEKAYFEVYCKDIKTLDFSSLHFKQVTTIKEMFSNTEGLEKIIFPKFNDNILIDIDSTFYGCSVKEIDWNGFTAAAVKNLNHTFYNCKIVTIDLSTFNLKNCESFEYTFACFRADLPNTPVNTNLTSIIPPGTPSDKVYTISHMFENCKKLKEIDLSKFISKDAVITDMDSTFKNCENLKKIIMPQCFNSEHQIDISETFATTSNLTEIIGPFPTPKGSFAIKLSYYVTNETLERIVEALERHKGTIDNPFTLYMSTYIRDSKMTEEQRQRIQEANWIIDQIN